MTTIAIKIKNPTRVAALFGAEAGDYRTFECRYWSGTPDDLHPVASIDAGTKVVNAAVEFCGDSARIKRKPRIKAPDSFRCGYSDILGSGVAIQLALTGDIAHARRCVGAAGRLFKPQLP